MEAKQALEKEQKTDPPGPIFVEAEKLFDQMKEFTQAVAQQAYWFFKERRGKLGHDLEDWFRAEFELMRPVPTELKENADRIIVRAEVPGFKAEEIKISVEPNRVIFSGKPEPQKEEETEQKVFSEFHGTRFYREIGLPAEVDPAKATVTLKDGILELKLVKAEKREAVDVEVKAA
jgi:HSP20 family protein